MSSRRLLGDASTVKTLADRLFASPQIRSLGQDSPSEAGTLAHTFADLEDSFRKFLEKELPRLVGSDATHSDITGILLDIGEEFRHILYHLKEPRFYRYLFEENGASE
jgi:hypothetical protein